MSSTQSLRRVVVTGLGSICCLGGNVDIIWSRLLAGGCGITALPQELLECGFPSRIAGTVDDNDMEGFVKTPDIKRLSRANLLADYAAHQALSDANLLSLKGVLRNRIGVAIGTGMMDLAEAYSASLAFERRGYRGTTPYLIPRLLANMPAGVIAIKHGLKGPNHSVSTACTTGLHAIGDAFRFIRHGDADIMVCGGTEASVNRLALSGFCRMRALSTQFNDTPELASRPFDKDRDGFVIAEGAAVLILEEMESAFNRGANIYAEILGYGLSADAHHITSPDENGDGAYRCMQACLHDAGQKTIDIGYVNAHATSTPLGDVAECRALRKLFFNNGNNVKISSTKGATGHLLGAAGAIEVLFSVLACQKGKTPPSLNLFSLDEEFVDLTFVNRLTNMRWRSEKRVAVSNSFGFGGTNASLCLSNY